MKNNSSEKITDWNNFEGHIVASAFVMSKSTRTFAVVFHDEFKVYIYPGGHIDNTDSTPLSAAKREVMEETGLKNLETYNVCDDELVPFDIDIHHLSRNEKFNLPPHYHFDFRYFFLVDGEEDLVIDENEASGYKWVSFDELKSNPFYSRCIDKIEKVVNEYK